MILDQLTQLDINVIIESFETEKQNFTFFPQSVTVAYER